MPRKLKPVHPGEILSNEFMKPLGLSQNKLALGLRVSVTRVGEIVNPRHAISADTALRLSRYFKNEPVFWMNLQVKYDLDVAQIKIAAKVARDVHPHEASPAPHEPSHAG